MTQSPPLPARTLLAQATRRNKYHAEACEEDGYRFASLAEREYYRQLRLRYRAKEIVALTVHPRFALMVNDILVGHFTPDFDYLAADGTRHVVDVKGVRTEGFVVRAKLFRALYGIEVEEVRIERRRGKKARGRFSGSRKTGALG